MNTISKLIDRIYTQIDFGRSVVTSFSGVVGLVIYLLFRDWVIAGLLTIISFPIARLFATWGYNSIHNTAEHQKVP